MPAFNEVSRKRGCSLVWHRASNIIFCSRPSLTDAPACVKPPLRYRQAARADTEAKFEK